jgi:hypothetical protein
MEEELERRGFELVDRIHASEGYDWWEMALWLDPRTQRVYMYTDSGCSCNGPYDFMGEVGDRELDLSVYMERVFNPQQISSSMRWLPQHTSIIEKTNLLQAGTRALYRWSRQNMAIE